MIGRVASHSQFGPQPRGFFVTGTDTGVGKTLVACALLYGLAARGYRAVGMKPVAAGAHEERGRLVNEDAAALHAAGNVAADEGCLNPYCFEPAIAPHIAAAEAGVRIERERILDAFRALALRGDYVIVEGAGGFRVPLGFRFDTADLATELRLPVVLVVGMRLGCLNHALLTADAIRAARVRLAGWVANHTDAQMQRPNENVSALKERLDAPLLARIEHRSQPDPRSIARDLDLDPLLDAVT